MLKSEFDFDKKFGIDFKMDSSVSSIRQTFSRNRLFCFDVIYAENLIYSSHESESDFTPLAEIPPQKYTEVSDIAKFVCDFEFWIILF